MKKVLFGSTALVAAAFAGSAFANGVTLSVGGFMEAGVGVGQYADGFGDNVDKDFHIITNGEIQFKAKGTMDNGITVEVRVELESYNDSSTTSISEADAGVDLNGDGDTADTISTRGETGNVLDEVWVSVGSSFGKVLVGYNDTAADAVAGGIGRMGSGVSAGSWDGSYVFVPGAIGDHLGDNGDDAAIHYYTPNISGFEAGISWAPGSGNGTTKSYSDTNQDITNSNDVISVAASYANTFGDVDFAIGGGWGTEDADSGATSDEYGGGVEVGISGFTIGGAIFFEDEQAGFGGLASDTETLTYGGGVTYATGPWEFGVNAAYQDVDADTNSGDNEKLRVNAGVAYELGDGVNVGAHVDYGDIDYDSSSTNSDEDGWGGGFLIGVSF